jgi:hypothetical protein
VTIGDGRLADLKMTQLEVIRSVQRRRHWSRGNRTVTLSITHNSGLFGGSRHRRNIESKVSGGIHC